MSTDEEAKNDRKRVGIITTNVHTSLNYGGVLQAYALQQVILNLGCGCEIIQYSTSGKRVATFLKSEFHENSSLLLLMKRTFQLGSSYISSRLKRVFLSAVKTVCLNKHMGLREAVFSDFKKSRIALSKEIYTRENIQNSVSDYDIFVCGSDMIWKPGKYDPTYFLDFVPDDKLKIAYAPSIGVSHLSDSEKAYMKPLVNRLDAVSVREKHGKELLELVTEKDVSWVLDPTLLLSREMWDSVAKPYAIERPYLFCYLLGKNAENYAFVEKTAKRLGLFIVTIPFVAGDHVTGITFGDKQIYDAGPEHFISLIRNAELIITDSFHGTVFSIIYGKEFITLPRSNDTHNSSNSRIYSLLELFGLNDRVVNLSNEVINDLLREAIDYNNVNMIIQRKRDESLNYLMRLF